MFADENVIGKSNVSDIEEFKQTLLLDLKFLHCLILNFPFGFNFIYFITY